MPKWKEPKPLKSDPKKAKEWQDRSRLAAIERLRERGKALAPREAGNGPSLRSGALQRKPLQSRKPSDGSVSPSKSGPSGTSLSPQMRAQNRTRPNDSPWRAAVMAYRGEVCVSCGTTVNVQADHVIPKSQMPSCRADVLNGLPLCGPFGNGCHDRKTAGELKIDPAWLTGAQLQYLLDKNWLAFDAKGEPIGLGHKHFLPRRGRGPMEGGQQ